MAMIAIIVIVLFAAAVAGHFFVKKERRKQVEKRQQRVKIAEGDFDQIPVEAPKRKLFQRKRLEFAPLPIAEKQAAEITAALPGAVTATLDALNAYKTKIKAAADAAREYDTRRNNLASFRFTPANGATDVLALASLYRAVEVAAAAHYQKESESRAEHGKLRSNLRALDKIAASTRGYDLSPLSEGVVKLLSLASSLVQANPYEQHSASRSAYQRGDVLMLNEDEDEKRQAKDIVTSEMTALFMTALDELWEPVCALQSARKAVQEAAQKLDEVNKATPAEGPEKPSDQDVTQFTSAVFAWVESVNEAETGVEAAHKQLRDALDLSCAALQIAKRAGKEADHVALSRGRHRRNAVLKAGATALSIVSGLHDECLKLLPAQPSTAHSLQDGLVLEPAVEARLDASLRATIRKLAFALAQENAAGMRVSALIEKGLPQVKVDEPSLAAADAETYLRQFEKWTVAKSLRDAESSAYEQKLAEARAAVLTRGEQVGQVVQNLVAQLAEIEPTAVISAEFDSCVRAASWLADKNRAYLKS